MYETVLIPTDGSSGSERTIEAGLGLAVECDASVHALSVIDVADLLEVELVGDRDEFEATIEPLEDEAKRAVEVVRERARRMDDLEVLTVVREGTPHETIVEYADEVDADVIVMGAHGRRGLARYLLGSTTERVLRTTDVPVLTVRIDEA